MQPGAPVAEGEVEDLAQDFADAYAEEDTTTLGRLLTRDVERVVPGARQEGRTAVLTAYKRQFDDSDTRTFKLEDLEVQGGSAGRASGRYVATYKGEPDVTGAIAFNVLRDRGEPRIALISARQDTAAETRSASSSPRWSATSAGRSTWRWRGPRRRAASTRSGSATTCSTRPRTAGPSAGRGRRGRSLAALASATERVRLGPLVACAGFHPPALIAKMAATIAEVSGGRFVLGARRGLERARVHRARPALRPPRRPLRGGLGDHPRAARRRAGHARRPLLAGRRRRAPPPPGVAAAADDRLQRAAHALDRAPARGLVEHVVRRLRQHG